MTIKTGDKIPSVILKNLTPEGMQDLSTDSFFTGKNVVLFCLPGAFTPTCTANHLASYVQNLAEFQKLGLTVACLSVNDPFVMRAWSVANKAEGITMLADGNGTLTKAMGLEMDGTANGLGTRSRRAALYLENGIVKSLMIENPGKFEVSGAEAMLKTVGGLKEAA